MSTTGPRLRPLWSRIASWVWRVSRSSGARQRRIAAIGGEYQRYEREQIQSALVRAKWNIAMVSRTLGIPRNSLYRKLKKYRIEQPTS